MMMKHQSLKFQSYLLSLQDRNEHGSILRTIALILVILAATVIIALGIISSKGSTRLENWLGGHLINIADYYLVPDLTFETIDYQAPYTFIITGTKLTANNGKVILNVPELELVVSERPRMGHPIHIASLRLKEANINLLQTKDGFAGFSPFVHPGEDRAEQQTQFKLSDFLSLRLVSIENGNIICDPGDGSPPMVWHDINLNLTDKHDEQGLTGHDLRFSVELLPIASLDVSAIINLDTLDTNLQNLTLALDLSDNSYSILPPDVQQVLHQLKARGTLLVEADGKLVIDDLSSGSVYASVSGNNLYVNHKNMQLDIEKLSGIVTLEHNRLDMVDFRIDTLGGVLTASADLDLSSANQLLKIDWTATDINLSDLINRGKGDSENTSSLKGNISVTDGETTESKKADTSLEGILTGEGMLSYSLSTGIDSLTGKGRININKGRLIVLPVISEAARAAFSITSQSEPALADRAEFTFDIYPDHLHIDEYSIVSQLLAARGKGNIYYNGKLALTMNGGPLEKAQDAMGMLGDIFGSITDTLVTYDIEGTINDPTFTIRPLGLGSAPE